MNYKYDEKSVTNDYSAKISEVEKLKVEMRDANIEIECLKRRVKRQNYLIGEVRSMAITNIKLMAIIVAVLILSLAMIIQQISIIKHNNAPKTETKTTKQIETNKVEDVKKSLTDKGMNIAAVIESDDKVFFVSDTSDYRTFDEVKTLAETSDCSIATFTCDADYAAIMGAISTKNNNYMLGTYIDKGEWVNYNGSDSDYASKHTTLNDVYYSGVMTYNGKLLKYGIDRLDNVRPYIIEYKL